MTREHKLALIIAFSVVLVVGVLLSDHFSRARSLRSEAAADRQLVNAPTRDPLETHTPGRNPVISNGLPAGPGVDLIQPVNPANQQEPPIISMAGLRGAPALTQTGELFSAQPDWSDETPPEQEQPQAQPAGPKVTTGKLIRHEVAPGDTLSEVAAKYYKSQKYWKELQLYNKARLNADGSVRTGVTLLVPPIDVLMGQAVLPDEAKAVRAPDADASKSGRTQIDRPEQADKPEASMYTVQSGDTLYSIAAKRLGNSSKWKQIRDLNKDQLDDEASLNVGMKLRLPR